MNSSKTLLDLGLMANIRPPSNSEIVRLIIFLITTRNRTLESPSSSSINPQFFCLVGEKEISRRLSCHNSIKTTTSRFEWTLVGSSQGQRTEYVLATAGMSTKHNSWPLYVFWIEDRAYRVWAVQLAQQKSCLYLNQFFLVALTTIGSSFSLNSLWIWIYSRMHLEVHARMHSRVLSYGFCTEIRRTSCKCFTTHNALLLQVPFLCSCGFWIYLSLDLGFAYLGRTSSNWITSNMLYCYSGI